MYVIDVAYCVTWPIVCSHQHRADCGTVVHPRVMGKQPQVKFRVAIARAAAIGTSNQQPKVVLQALHMQCGTVGLAQGSVALPGHPVAG